MKLLNHLKAMQAMATTYLVPEDYVDRDGRRAIAGDAEGRMQLFIGDLLHMLDGPEQREAQAEAEELCQIACPSDGGPGNNEDGGLDCSPGAVADCFRTLAGQASPVAASMCPPAIVGTEADTKRLSDAFQNGG